MRSADIMLFGRLAGRLDERDEGGYSFRYDPAYLALPDAAPLSFTLPLRPEPFPVRILAPADPEESALTINGKKANLQKKDFSRLALSFGLSEAQDRRTITQMCASVRSVLDEVLAASFLSAGFKERFREMALSRLTVLDE